MEEQVERPVEDCQVELNRRFGSVGGSYAARKGKARNVGVIGIAFFHERGSSWGWGPDEVRRRNSADPFPGQFAEPPPGW